MKQIGVYMIMNITNGKRYIGSSKNILRRWSQHKYDIVRKSNQMYQDMKELGFDKFQFTVLEECTIEELKIREQYYINTLHPEYNRNKADTGISVSKKDDIKAYKKEYRRKYYQEHKYEENERRRKYYKEHKSEEDERRQQYYKEHKEEIKERKRKYRQEHKEAISEYYRKYYETHKDYFKRYREAKKLSE